jgi:hypothetical protein
MPVTYQIDQANGIIRTKCTGAVTIEEVLNHFRELERDPKCPERLDVLLDLSEQTSVPNQRNVQDVAFEIARVRGRIQFGICAIVASTDALFGMLRMFEVLAEEFFDKSHVFRSISEAEAWLASERRTGQSTSPTGGPGAPE